MDVLPWQHAVNRSGLSVFLQLGRGGGGSPPRRAIVTPDVPLVMNRDKESVYWVGMSRRRRWVGEGEGEGGGLDGHMCLFKSFS